MDIQTIPLISVSYNSAELIKDLLSSFRRHYANPVTIIDGSSVEHVSAIEAVCAKYPDVKFIHFDYNIHHGPGMAWAYQNLELQGPVLVLDSDVFVLNPGLIEALATALKPDMYGVGYVNHVNEGGFDVDYEVGAVRYLHPACMLCNIDVVRQWPMPTKHGAPNIEAMLAIHRAGQHQLIKGLDWVKEDFSRSEAPKHYLRHDWQGTVLRTGGYHLEEWQRSVALQQSAASHVPPVPDYNEDVLKLIPANARAVVAVGGQTDALARAYRAVQPNSQFTGLAAEVLQAVDSSFVDSHASCDVWILDDVLTRVQDPWGLLACIRSAMPANGCVILCLPNAQHWSMQAKLAVGDFRYEAAGSLLDRDHMRYFTRATMLELIAGAGFKLQVGFPRMVGELKNEYVIAAIRSMAIGVGADPGLAVQDSLPLQYVVKVVPGQ